MIRLLKAKTENNWVELAVEYRKLLYQSDENKQIKYADSSLAAALKSRNNEIIGKAYLTKGILSYKNKMLTQALDNYIKANEYIIKTQNQYDIYKIKYSIAHTKYYLGFYHEAIALFKECLVHFEEENDLAYLTTIHSLGLCYNKIGNFDLSSYYNHLGFDEGEEFENNEMEVYFKQSEAINKFYKKEYNQTIPELLSIIPEIKKRKDFANETIAYFFIGKSYWNLNQVEKAIPYFIKVDNSFTNQKYTRPELRENYELLIKYYKKKNIPELQLQYINRLLRVDSTLNLNYVYLSKKIIKEYDTKELKQEKERIEQEMKNSNRTHYAIIAFLSLTSFGLTARHHRNKKRFKQKFEELMKNNTRKENNSLNQTPLEISPELAANIIQNLEKFEKNKKFLEKDMTLSKLATQLKTNTKYASKIILKYRNKKTIEYISDLKIDYIIELLKKENKFRNYTNTGLAEEAGFGSTQNFTRAFKIKTGMPPTFFVQELKKSTNNGSLT
ncbi:helix-turn-helix domain-containing protein [Flavobacterium sp.]